MQILNFQEQPPNSTTVALFSVYFPVWEMTWHRVKLIKTKKGRMFVALPTYCEKLDDDLKKFNPYIEFSDKKSQGFQKTVLDLLSEFMTIEQ